MPIVTLTTDWGTRDHYLASFKGLLATQCPEASVIDITNDVDHFDILQASFILKNCYDKFPAGTIHFIGVRGNEVKRQVSGYVLVECNGHFFIGYDNGVFSLTLDDAEKSIYETDIDANDSDSAINERLVEIISLLVKGESPAAIFKPSEKLRSVLNSTPSFDSNTIRGAIIYIDSFQNIITNIPKNLFVDVGGPRSFTVVIRNHECKFKKVYSHYADADMGEPVILFNEKGMLEFALNGANAAGLMGVKVLDNIRIEFQGVIGSPNQEGLLPSNEKALTGN